MSPNTKDPEAHRLAQAISRTTGESTTRVVTETLRERYARIEHRQGKASVAELLAIADRVAAHLKRPYLDHANFLHNDDGLPNGSQRVRHSREPKLQHRAGAEGLAEHLGHLEAKESYRYQRQHEDYNAANYTD